MAIDSAGTLALLIDGDNATPKSITGLLAEIANYGTASVKRIYGDWTKPNLNGWKECLLEHSIQPVQQFAYTTGKNATDGAMIIDAMDLLYTGRFSGFCIVSSDSDFARLAARIREQGVIVYGFGERKTPRPFITACDKFVYFDVLNTAGEQKEAEAVAAPKATAAKPAPAKAALDRAALDMLAKAVTPRPTKTAAPIWPASARTWRNSRRISTPATMAFPVSPIWSRRRALSRSSALAKIRKSSWFASRADQPLAPLDRRK